MNKKETLETRQILMGNTLVDVKAVEAKRLETDRLKGWLESYNLENYGPTQYFWWPDGITGADTEQRRNRSMMPPEYVYKFADDFKWDLYKEDVTKQKAVANSFVKNFETFQREGRGLFIYSATKGSGKTFLSCILGNEIIMRYGISVKFISVPDFIELIKAKDDQHREIVKALEECSLLIFDDIGAEAGNKDWIQSAVFRLIDRRDRDLSPTIYTSNFDMEDLPGDERTVNRIIGHSVPLPMPGQSIRKEVAEKRTGDFLKDVLSTEQKDIFIN